MRDFVLAALPWVLCGVAVAIICAGMGRRKNRENGEAPENRVALGMALTATSLPDGNVVRNVVLFAVLVYELVGPTLTRNALMRAGEIDPEGRTSARTPNKESAPMPPLEKE